MGVSATKVVWVIADLFFFYLIKIQQMEKVREVSHHT